MRSSFNPSAPAAMRLEHRFLNAHDGGNYFPVQRVVTMFSTFGPVVTVSANYGSHPGQPRGQSHTMMGAVGPGCCAGPLNSRTCKWCKGELIVEPFMAWAHVTPALLRPYIMLNPLASEIALAAVLDFIELLASMAPEMWATALPEAIEVATHG